MTKKQYRRKVDFIQGYRRGYQRKGLSQKNLMAKTEDYKRGYREGRKDIAQREPALY